jgi:group I intron endonuclease
MDEILELSDKDKIKGQIYKITNTTNNMCYIGQTRTHVKNHNKYRFNSHISASTSRIKRGCVYLCNSIKSHGPENFKVELIEECDISNTDERECYYISFFNTLHPNGYNLTTGGKGVFFVGKIIECEGLKIPVKRGRPFGYKHKETSKTKISKQSKKNANIEEFKEKAKNRMGGVIRKYYDEKKIKMLSEKNLPEDLYSCIKPVINKNTKLIHDYQIYFNRRERYKLCSKNETLEEKRKCLEYILTKAKELKDSKNS